MWKGRGRNACTVAFLNIFFSQIAQYIVDHRWSMHYKWGNTGIGSSKDCIRNVPRKGKTAEGSWKPWRESQNWLVKSKRTN